MPTDQMFKELIVAFFFQFLRLFFPAIAEAIDPASLVQRSPELFTDVPSGRLRRADLVFEARTLAGEPPAVLFQTEVQARRDLTMPTRMRGYNMGLEFRSGVPVISIEIALYGGTRGITLEVHSRTLFGTVYPQLAYWQVGLRDLDAATYLQSDLPLAMALAALMRPGPMKRHGLKIALIRRVRASTVDKARLSLIVNVIESFLKLDPEEQQAFREQLRAEGDETVEATEMTWADEMMQRGREQALAEARREMATWADEMMQRGREQALAEARREMAARADEMMQRGREQGREQGVLEAKREIALLQIRGRFGQPDAALRAQIEAAEGPALDRLLERLPDASTIEQVVSALN